MGNLKVHILRKLFIFSKLFYNFSMKNMIFHVQDNSVFENQNFSRKLTLILSDKCKLSIATL